MSVIGDSSKAVASERNKQKFERFLALADKAADKHRDFSKRSREAFLRGDRALASQLSKEGKQHKKQGDRYNRRAQKFIFASKNSNLPKETIDLHRLFVARAERCLLQRMNEVKAADGEKISVIVGKGKHATNGPRIKPAIEELCNNRGLKYTYEVNKRTGEVNDGKMIILLEDYEIEKVDDSEGSDVDLSDAADVDSDEEEKQQQNTHRRTTSAPSRPTIQTKLPASPPSSLPSPSSPVSSSYSPYTFSPASLPSSSPSPSPSPPPLSISTPPPPRSTRTNPPTLTPAPSNRTPSPYSYIPTPSSRLYNPSATNNQTYISPVSRVPTYTPQQRTPTPTYTPPHRTPTPPSHISRATTPLVRASRTSTPTIPQTYGTTPVYTQPAQNYGITPTRPVYHTQPYQSDINTAEVGGGPEKPRKSWGERFFTAIFFACYYCVDGCGRVLDGIKAWIKARF